MNSLQGAAQGKHPTNLDSRKPKKDQGRYRTAPAESLTPTPKFEGDRTSLEAETR